ncbi:MAG: TrkA family potassium uptake protein [Halolamina sp.]
MSEPSRRAVRYLAGVLLIVVAYAAVYRTVLATFEGQQVSLVQALALVVQTFTTTGYGEQAGLWSHPATFGLVIAMQFTGVLIVFLTLPTLVVPLIDDALSASLPTSTDLTDHVVVVGWSPTTEVLTEGLVARDQPYVVITADDERARSLQGEGHDVICGDPATDDTLVAAGVPEARAVVACLDDETNATVALTTQRVDDSCQVLTVAEDDAAVEYHRYAGADDVVSPRRTLGRSLAEKAVDVVSLALGDTVEVGKDFDIAELIVHRGSPMVGRTIADCGVDDAAGVQIIGAWFRGRFEPSPAPDHVVDEHTVLLVAGPPKGIETLKERTQSRARRQRRSHVVVAGHGVTGSTATERLAESGRRVVVIDVEDGPSVDVVGDVTESETLREADLQNARSLLLTLDDDGTAVFATLVARQVAPEIEVIACAVDDDNVANLYQAGAEYVLARSTVNGRVLASLLFEEEVVTPESQVEIVRRAAPGLTGRSLGGADVRNRTGCSVIAVQRNGDVRTDVGPEFVVHADDDLVVAGDDAAIQRFSELAR